MIRPMLQPSHVYFDELTHTYLRDEDNKELKGITSTLIPRAFPGTYDDVPDDVMQHAAERGTAVHKAIEAHAEENTFDDIFLDVVAEAFVLLKAKGIEPIAVEYVVTDGENYATPIDLVCANKKGEVFIVDIKTTSSKMYEHVQLQCSICKMFFERQNPTIKVKGLYCLWLHVNDFYNVLDSDLFPLEPVNEEFIGHLMECDLADEEFDITKFYGNLPAEVKDVEKYLKELDTLVREKTDELKMIKEGLLRMMHENNVKTFDTGHTRLTRILGQKRTSFDSARFEQEHPEMFKEYLKETTTKESIRVTFK